MKRVTAVLVVLAAVLISFFVWWKVSLLPVNPQDTKLQAFIIAKGDGVREIAKKLRDQGLIRDQIAFFALVKWRLGIDKNIQAGSYRLTPSLSLYDLASKLTSGTEDLWITIPEGWRSEEILEYLKAQGFNVDDANWGPEEGKLFPDTYLIPKQMTISAVHDLLRQTFDTRTAGLTITPQTLILASIVEREARHADDRPLVASVLLNRLNIGMKLDVDATVQYVVGKSGDWWPKQLSLADLKVKSLYNTYTNNGLPPAPISNPGLSAINAALHPAQTDYLYYLSDKAGTIHYARTLDEHNSNVAKYLQ